MTNTHRRRLQVHQTSHNRPELHGEGNTFDVVNELVELLSERRFLFTGEISCTIRVLREGVWWDCTVSLTIDEIVLHLAKLHIPRNRMLATNNLIKAVIYAHGAMRHYPSIFTHIKEKALEALVGEMHLSGLIPLREEIFSNE